jgi:hypothetical protein
MSEASILKSCNESLKMQLDAANNKMVELEDDLEVHRMRLAACGVIALANTEKTAKEQRIMSDDYKSASLSDVMRIVDSEMLLRKRNAELEKDIAFLQSCVNSGEAATKSDRPSERAKALKELECL